MIDASRNTQMAFCGNQVIFKPRKLMEMKFEHGKFYKYNKIYLIKYLNAYKINLQKMK